MGKGEVSQKMYIKQSSFAGGEVSPDLYGRDDMVKYSVSMKQLSNFFPHPFGGFSNRPGLQYIAEVKDSTKKVKLLPFQFNNEQADIIEAGENYFRYIKGGGQIIDPTTSAIIETATTYNESDLFNLKIAQSADTVYICNNKYKPKTLTRSSHYNWTFADFNYANGPFRKENVTDTSITPSAITGTGITLTATSNIFTSDQVGSLFQISHDVTNQSIIGNYTGTATTNTIKCNGTWSLTTGGTWHGLIYVQWSKDNGVTWENIRTYRSGGATNISDSGNTDQLVLLRMYLVLDTAGIDITLNAYSFVNDGVVKITSVTSGTVAIGDVITDYADNNIGIAMTTATTNWSEGAWSTKNGYPSCVKFYQNRLCFAGTTKDPLTLWMSNIGDYPNFLVHPVVVDSDAIEAPLVSQGVNAIRSMVSVDNMLAFTAAGEWKIGTGSESTGLSPTTVRATQQEYRGASTLDPLIVGNRVLYCQDMGSTVRDIGYSLSDDVYKGDDLTLMARHFFRNFEIVDWAYQAEPDGIIWAIKSDGILLSLTYLKDQDVYGWSEHTTAGEFESIASIPGTNYSEVYFVVKRDINGTTKRFIEKLAHRMESADPRDQFFVDCGLSLDNPIAITGITKTNPVVITAPSHGLAAGNYVDISDVIGMINLNGYRYKVGVTTTNTFTIINMDDSSSIDGAAFKTYKSGGNVRKAVLTVSGLDHLNGETVTILADGSVNTPQIVTNGSITLDDYASRIHVGLGYNCDAETLDIDFPVKNGTVQGRFKRISEITLRVENTFGGSVGINGPDNIEIIEQTLSTTWGKPGNLVTGDMKVSPYADLDTHATVFIRQSDPLPMTILSIISGVEFGDN